jgi:peptidoglycan/xylan/chitin deacetylase (PgdA/CDA1 family)
MRLLKDSLKEGLLKAGIYKRRLRRHPFPGVAVLCYHGVRAQGIEGGLPFQNLHVPAMELETHCQVIREICSPVSLGQVRLARAGQTPLPPRPVLVTFDDGYRSVATCALPILKRYSIPAVVFVCSNPVLSQTMFWYDAVASSHGEAAVDALKRMSFEQWRDAVCAESRHADDDEPLAPLSVDQVRELSRSEGVELGAHTASHLVLKHADLDRQREEISCCKQALIDWTGRPIIAFAYPNGQPGLDYGPETVALVRGAGFDLGFTTNYGFARPEEPDLELSRFIMLAGVSGPELAHRLAYSWPR